MVLCTVEYLPMHQNPLQKHLPSFWYLITASRAPYPITLSNIGQRCSPKNFYLYTEANTMGQRQGLSHRRKGNSAAAGSTEIFLLGNNSPVRVPVAGSNVLHGGGGEEGKISLVTPWQARGKKLSIQRLRSKAEDFQFSRKKRSVKWYCTEERNGSAKARRIIRETLCRNCLRESVGSLYLLVSF